MPGDKIAESILVVDDDLPSADALAAALVDSGYSASAAYGTTEAITALEATRQDLVVITIKAAAPLGLVPAGILRERFAVPLVFISALQDEQTVRQATALGAIAYLVRPQDVRQCIPTIETALARAEDLSRLRQSEAQLSAALQQNRTTGVAVGILVERLRLGRNEAFETLRENARSRRRGLIDVAEHLVSSAETLNEITRAGSQARR
ncbi:MAG: hypothetical protein JWN85_5141 [Gammaproteobacteria bacterium]|nr:hypothetical protein [Gammaproteobacteria bacterium]